jgi:D-serine dehydratase
MYPDLVCAELTRPWPRPVRVVLRSGCYLTHDHQLYAGAAPAHPELVPALRVWSRVLSVPEPGWAILDAGRRDLTVDPPARVLRIHRGDSARPVDLRIDHHNDQHGYVAFGAADLRVGDICELGISHPCLTFDRWTHIPLIDDARTVVGVIRTVF